MTAITSHIVATILSSLTSLGVVVGEEETVMAYDIAKSIGDSDLSNLEVNVTNDEICVRFEVVETSEAAVQELQAVAAQHGYSLEYTAGNPIHVSITKKVSMNTATPTNPAIAQAFAEAGIHAPADLNAVEDRRAELNAAEARLEGAQDNLRTVLQGGKSQPEDPVAAFEARAAANNAIHKAKTFASKKAVKITVGTLAVAGIAGAGYYAAKHFGWIGSAAEAVADTVEAAAETVTAAFR